MLDFSKSNPDIPDDYNSLMASGSSALERFTLLCNHLSSSGIFFESISQDLRSSLQEELGKEICNIAGNRQWALLSSFLSALEEHQHFVVRDFISDIINFRGRYGCTMLNWVGSDTPIEVVNKAISLGADVSYINPRNTSFLYIALLEAFKNDQYWPLCDLLIDKGVRFIQGERINICNLIRSSPYKNHFTKDGFLDEETDHDIRLLIEFLKKHQTALGEETIREFVNNLPRHSDDNEPKYPLLHLLVRSRKQDTPCLINEVISLGAEPDQLYQQVHPLIVATRLGLESNVSSLIDCGSGRELVISILRGEIEPNTIEIGIW